MAEKKISVAIKSLNLCFMLLLVECNYYNINMCKLQKQDSLKFDNL
jgi:hypothetical protein